MVLIMLFLPVIVQIDKLAYPALGVNVHSTCIDEPIAFI